MASRGSDLPLSRLRWRFGRSTSTTCNCSAWRCRVSPHTGYGRAVWVRPLIFLQQVRLGTCQHLSMQQLPVAILMSGAPGSGKSTLAALLGQRLRLPVIDKDTLRRAKLWGLGVDDVNKAPWGVGLWFPIMGAHLSAGVSVIGDMTLFRALSEADVAARLAPLARLAQVHCRCEAARERFVARTQADPLRRRHLNELLPQATALASELEEPLDLDCPILEVNTTDGYQPDIAKLSEAIVTMFAPHLRALLDD